MATSDFWQRLSATVASSHEWEGGVAGEPTRAARGTAKLWMVMDVISISGAATLATIYKSHSTEGDGMQGLWDGNLMHSRSVCTLLALLCGFAIALMITSKRLHLYSPTRLTGILHEQRLSMQACFTSGLLLTGALYVLRADDIPRSIILITVGLVAVSLGLRRLVHRVLLYSRYDHGVGTRNVLILGNGPEAHALRHHLESIRHLGYTFKGFIDIPGSSPRSSSASGDVVGTLDSLFERTRSLFVDEIFVTSPCERVLIQNVLEQSRIHGVDLRIVPDMYNGLSWNSPIEFIGQFPTIPLHCGHVPEVGLLFKRAFDIVFSALFLILFAPLLLIIAIAVKLDSPGPALYSSERIGKKGRVFGCFKFRTMVQDAETRRADVMHMNERDGVLFKISNDPRITRLGHFLRKYSLDELPQFFNVLKGEMSIVGPRPPIASEVKAYKLSHLRRLDVTPGITGLWQVQGRQDPSFDSYVSLDVTYIDNWSFWLDFNIIMKTIGVVFAGTGT
jgi:exopolysaccharide biosynthesis polyprenyl glycosylphosphotransferase